MSVILESQPGDEIVCIQEFHVSPYGRGFSWKTCRAFRVGERVKFTGSFEDKHTTENPVCWMVLFHTSDGKQYAASQTLFVTRECWEGLAKHLNRKKAQAPKKAKRPNTVNGVRRRRIA